MACNGFILFFSEDSKCSMNAVDKRCLRFINAMVLADHFLFSNNQSHKIYQTLFRGFDKRNCSRFFLFTLLMANFSVSDFYQIKSLSHQFSLAGACRIIVFLGSFNGWSSRPQVGSKYLCVILIIYLNQVL